jgi:hypothetical protein
MIVEAERLRRSNPAIAPAILWCVVSLTAPIRALAGPYDFDGRALSTSKPK